MLQHMPLEVLRVKQAFALITHSIKEDHMPQQNYLDELTPAFTPLLAIKEASRCLLCHDAPCSQACPAQTDPGKFIRSIYFRNFKGAAETIRENNALGAVCARVCPTEKLCQSGWVMLPTY